MTTPSRILAAVLLAAAIGVAAAPARANAATGVISGQVLTDAGAPASGVQVTARRNDGPWLYTVTATDGSYRFDAVPPSSYVLLFEPRQGVRQFAHQKKRSSEADVFPVAEGQQLTVNETLLSRGNLAGRFVDFDGTPLAGAGISVRDVDGESYVSVQADADGVWRVDGVFAGRYDVRFNHGQSISQYAFGKVGVAQPDLITVSANQTATVNDTAVARTSLRITATDAKTGAALTTINAYVGDHFGSTDTGELVIDGVQAGTFDVQVDSPGYFHKRAQVTLAVGVPGQLAVALEPQSFVDVKVVDAATGIPLPGICVGAFTLISAVIGDGTCGERTDDAGNLRIGFVRPGVHQLFAVPTYGAPPGFGAQWVGPTGGTGRQAQAMSITVGRGETVAGPTIRLDRAGTITGRVSTPDGGVPRFGSVGVLTGHPISGSGLGVPIAEDGSYTIDFLGPYEWPLLFEANDQADQWSGHTGDRFRARAVRVNAGAVTKFGFRFRPAVRTKVVVRGLPEPLSFVLAYNAVTGDIMGAGSVGPNPEADLLLVGPQQVKFQVWPATNSDPVWAGGPDFVRAQPFRIPSRGSTTVTLTF